MASRADRINQEIIQVELQRARIAALYEADLRCLDARLVNLRRDHAKAYRAAYEAERDDVADSQHASPTTPPVQEHVHEANSHHVVPMAPPAQGHVADEYSHHGAPMTPPAQGHVDEADSHHGAPMTPRAQGHMDDADSHHGAPMTPPAQERVDDDAPLPNVSMLVGSNNGAVPPDTTSAAPGEHQGSQPPSRESGAALQDMDIAVPHPHVPAIPPECVGADVAHEHASEQEAEAVPVPAPVGRRPRQDSWTREQYKATAIRPLMPYCNLCWRQAHKLLGGPPHKRVAAYCQAPPVALDRRGKR